MTARLIVMDIDSTLINQEVIDLLGEEAGVGKQVAQITERAMRGELDFKQALEERVGLLAGLDESVFERTFERVTFTPGALEAVQALQGKYRLFLASNGTATVQHSRLTSAGLYPYFEKVFVSQDIGYNKPARDYFEDCFRQIPDFCPERAIMVGDSLTSDVLGGINAGIRTCWVNPAHAPARANIQPDYEIENLSQLEEVLKTL